MSRDSSIEIHPPPLQLRGERAQLAGRAVHERAIDARGPAKTGGVRAHLGQLPKEREVLVEEDEIGARAREDGVDWWGTRERFEGARGAPSIAGAKGHGPRVHVRLPRRRRG